MVRVNKIADLSKLEHNSITIGKKKNPRMLILDYMYFKVLHKRGVHIEGVEKHTNLWEEGWTTFQLPVIADGRVGGREGRASYSWQTPKTNPTFPSIDRIPCFLQAYTCTLYAWANIQLFYMYMYM